MAQTVWKLNRSIRFLDDHLADSCLYTFVIIVSRFKSDWIWVRHCERETWEIPAGHVESGETTETAAIRELTEETGSVGFQIEPVVSYEGDYQGKKVFGKIFYAIVNDLGALPAHEICETRLFKEMPEELTYPDIQPVFFNYVLDWLNQQPRQPFN